MIAGLTTPQLVELVLLLVVTGALAGFLAGIFGIGGGAVLAADLVVVGQRPQVDAIAGGAHGEFFGRQCAVGHHGVAVQVGIENGGHRSILGAPACRHGRMGARICY